MTILRIRRAAQLVVVIGLLAGALAEEDKPVKRQLPVGHRFALVNADGPRVDPRQLGFDPQQEIDPRQIVDPRQYAIDPRQLGPLHHPQQPVFPFGVDPRQLQGLGPQPIPGDPSQQQVLAPQYEQLLRYIQGNPGVNVQPVPQLQQQNVQSGPQQFQGQPRLVPVRLSPEQEQANRAQESIASQSIREQEEGDVQRRQQLEIQQYLQQQGISPEYLRQLQLQPQFANPQVQTREQAQARAQAEAQTRAQAEAQARAQAEAQARAQAEAQARAQAEAQARAQAEAQARAQAEAQARAQEEAQARAQAKAQEEANRRAQARAQEDANRRAHAEAEARVREEQARAEAAQLAAQAQLHTPSRAPQQFFFRDQQQTQEDVPEQLSYSQVQFGSTKLPRPPRLFSSPPSPRQLVYLASLPKGEAPPDAPPAAQSYPQPSPQPEYVQLPQHLPYRQVPAPGQRYGEGAGFHPIPSVSVKQTPDQYLIETTKVGPSGRTSENERQVVYRPSAAATAEDYQRSISGQQQQALIRQQQLEAATTPESPSRSSIFVTTSRTPVLRTKPTLQHQGGRPLTQGELRALLNAGYKVQPQAQEQLFQPQAQEQLHQPQGQLYQPQSPYFQPIAYYQPEQGRLGKRQNKPASKPVPKPVPLTDKEKSDLLAVGVRGLYRVDPQGKRGEHVKYVLAVGEPVQGQ